MQICLEGFLNFSPVGVVDAAFAGAPLEERFLKNALVTFRRLLASHECFLESYGHLRTSKSFHGCEVKSAPNAKSSEADVITLRDNILLQGGLIYALNTFEFS